MRRRCRPRAIPRMATRTRRRRRRRQVMLVATSNNGRVRCPRTTLPPHDIVVEGDWQQEQHAPPSNQQQRSAPRGRSWFRVPSLPRRRHSLDP
ncbi:hypothetical protein BCR44DRAFT_384367 [Catenaria anguillulae PL171]|uniref:Uncharacterized protein n=1 Tax=Catenaria anguillulae PL171 TaxID=765915 RepID=A0A1Y2HX52_9FUNG|nr:hypothetical protein BCR44DRAFT_384367 [Catenaria anguillulae PL171]